jgi:hypothetical protein
MEEDEDAEMSDKYKSSEGTLAPFPQIKGKEGINLNFPLYAAMENLQACSANGLRLLLTKLRNLNSRNLFL